MAKRNLSSKDLEMSRGTLKGSVLYACITKLQLKKERHLGKLAPFHPSSLALTFRGLRCPPGCRRGVQLLLGF